MGGLVDRIIAAVCLALTAGCTGDRDSSVLTADVPLHLDTGLESATVEGSEVPNALPAPREWRFTEPHSEWKPIVPVDGRGEPVAARQVDGALRLSLDSENRIFGDRLPGGAYVQAPLTPEQLETLWSLGYIH